MLGASPIFHNSFDSPPFIQSYALMSSNTNHITLILLDIACFYCSTACFDLERLQAKPFALSTLRLSTSRSITSMSVC